MALAHAILSVLLCQPCSGYDLAKRFDRSVEGSVGFFWTASFQQIYRELAKLEEQAWIKAEKIAQDHRPDKRLYALTTAGQEELARWIGEADKPAPIKDDLLVKIYAGSIVPKATIAAKILAYRDRCQERLAIYRAIEQAHFRQPEALAAVDQFPYLTLRCGIHYETSQLAWCEEAIAFLA